MRVIGLQAIEIVVDRLSADDRFPCFFSKPSADLLGTPVLLERPGYLGEQFRILHPASQRPIGTSLTSLLLSEMAAIITAGLLVALQFPTDRRWRSAKLLSNLFLRNLLAVKTGDDFSLFDGKMTHGG